MKRERAEDVVSGEGEGGVKVFMTVHNVCHAVCVCVCVCVGAYNASVPSMANAYALLYFKSSATFHLVSGTHTHTPTHLHTHTHTQTNTCTQCDVQGQHCNTK